MENLRLHLGNAPRGAQTDWPLQEGVLRIVRGEEGRLAVGDAFDGVRLAQFRIDKRGLWLLLDEVAQGVHVNGRPVRRMAMLRAGDSIHAFGAEWQVRADVAQAPPGRQMQAGSNEEADVCTVLRGVGGKCHGRTFPLGDQLRIGSGDDCGLRIEELAARHAELQRIGEQVVLRLPDPKLGCTVNGIECREALLRPGDQIAFAAHRFVLEMPRNSVKTARDSLPQPAIAAQAGTARSGAWRWPWLLLAALLLGLALSSLLLFGRH